MNFLFNLLGAESVDVEERLNNSFAVFKQFLDNYKIVIAIMLLIAGAFLAIVLGVMLAKAEDSGAAEKVKKRMWGLFITIFVLIVAIFFLDWILGVIPGAVGDLSNSVMDEMSR